MKIINQTAKSIYNLGDISTFCSDADEDYIDGVPIDEYVKQQTAEAKAKTREALLRALKELDDD